MHFFNPAPVMALVEVVSGQATERGVAAAVFATAAAWGKSPVHARSTPGFIVNRVARPFYAEALRVLAEGGGDAATLDAVMREAGGFRMGPFELMDLIGHDVNFAVTRSVYDAFYQDPRFTPSLLQQELVARRLPRAQERARLLPLRRGRGAGAAADGTAGAAAAAGHRQGRAWSARAAAAAAGSGRASRSEREDGPGRLEIDGAVSVALTDGRTRHGRMAAEGGLPLVLARPGARLCERVARGAGRGRPGAARGRHAGRGAVPGGRARASRCWTTWPA